MIRKPHDWESVSAFSDRQKLPVGAYVCKVLKVTTDSNQYGDLILIGYDIAEGEYKDFYRRDFAQNTNVDKRWKGILRVWIPRDDGSEKDEITKRSFKGMVTSFEKSNAGYSWNWDEQSLVGKLVGILYRNEEYDFNGHRGWSARPMRAMSVDTVRGGEYTLPNEKPLHGDAWEPTTAASGYTAVEDDAELPF